MLRALAILLLALATSFAAENDKTVRVIYLVSKDREPRDDFKAALEKAITQVRDWYASQLDGATFKLHDPVVEIARSDKEAAWFTNNPAGSNRDDWGHNNALAETRRLLGARNDDPNHIWIVYSDAPNDKGRAGAGFGYLPEDDLLGLIGQHPTQKKIDRWIGGLAHELGHAFGLPHPDDTKTHYDAIMWAGFYEKYPNGAYFLPSDKETLLKSPFIFKP